MATICRVPVAVSGTGVTGPGVSTFYTSNLSPLTFLGALHTFYDSLKGLFPDTVSFVFPSSGDLINDATGALAGSWTATPPSPVWGTQSGVFARGVGARCVWVTGGITRGRRVRGTTFLVPLAGNQYDTNGSLASGVDTSIAGGGGTLAAADSASMRIWSRPSAAGASDGASHEVLIVNAPDAVSWLRSRRT